MERSDALFLDVALVGYDDGGDVLGNMFLTIIFPLNYAYRA